MKQRAWDAAVAAVRKMREEANYAEMEAAAVQAVQPMICEYKHQQTCQRIIRRVYIFGATPEEAGSGKGSGEEGAGGAADRRRAAKQFEKAEAVALMPYKAAVATRK